MRGARRGRCLGRRARKSHNHTLASAGGRGYSATCRIQGRLRAHEVRATKAVSRITRPGRHDASGLDSGEKKARRLPAHHIVRTRNNSRTTSQGRMPPRKGCCGCGAPRFVGRRSDGTRGSDGQPGCGPDAQRVGRRRRRSGDRAERKVVSRALGPAGRRFVQSRAPATARGPLPLPPRRCCGPAVQCGRRMAGRATDDRSRAGERDTPIGA